MNYLVPARVEPLVNCVMVESDDARDAQFDMPLYADGYPGIMFQQSHNPFYFYSENNPEGKALSSLFMYGQTIKPARLKVEGPFHFVVLQLYPFAAKYLLGVDPKILNDECFDLLSLEHIPIQRYLHDLSATEDWQEQVAILTELIKTLLSAQGQLQDISVLNPVVRQSIDAILEAKGQVFIKDLLKKVAVTERTLERQFRTDVGLTPKQFARIMQFQCSLAHLNQSRFDKLTEVGMDSGFSDQSHFIRTFKHYTGQTPSDYLKQSLARQRA